MALLSSNFSGLRKTKHALTVPFLPGVYATYSPKPQDKAPSAEAWTVSSPTELQRTVTSHREYRQSGTHGADAASDQPAI